MRPLPEETPTPTDESERIARARQGDRDAQRLLFEAHARALHAVAWHVLDGDAAAEDVVQEAFVTLFTGSAAFRGESRLQTWLHRIVVNRCLDVRRARRRLQPIDEALPGPGDPETGARATERAWSVRAAVASLPIDQRVAVLLRHFEGLSYDEIAQVQACSPGTVASRLSRAHATLGARLAHLEAP